MNTNGATPKPKRKGWQSFNRGVFFTKKTEAETVDEQLDKAELMRGKSQRMGRRLMEAPGQ